MTKGAGPRNDSTVSHRRGFSLLAADLASGNIAGAYLLVGPSAKEKKSAALNFAKSLNCHNKSLVLSPESLVDKGQRTKDNGRSFEPCDACLSCRKIEERTHPDLFILDFESQPRLLELNSTQTEKQKEYHIEAVRSLIRSSTLTPVESQWKIFIIDGAELLSLESANALLKSLEEPSHFSCWILLTENFERILPTVRSRCRKILLPSQPPLTPPSNTPSAYASTPLQKGNEGEYKGVQFTELEKIVEDFLSGKKEPLKTVTELLTEKKRKARGQAESFLEVLAMRYSEKLHEEPSEKTANKLFQILQAREDLRKNANPQFVLDALLINLSTHP